MSSHDLSIVRRHLEKSQWNFIIQKDCCDQRNIQNFEGKLIWLTGGRNFQHWYSMILFWNQDDVLSVYYSDLMNYNWRSQVESSQRILISDWYGTIRYYLLFLDFQIRQKLNLFQKSKIFLAHWISIIR